MIVAVRRHFLSELLDMLRTGHHPDGRTLGPRLRPALGQIVRFLERDPEFGAAAGRISP